MQNQINSLLILFVCFAFVSCNVMRYSVCTAMCGNKKLEHCGFVEIKCYE